MVALKLPLLDRVVIAFGISEYDHPNPSCQPVNVKGYAHDSSVNLPTLD